MDDLRERVALITGAGGGVGQALAMSLAARGMHLGLLDVNADALAAVVAAVADGGPGRQGAIRCGRRR